MAKQLIGISIVGNVEADDLNDATGRALEIGEKLIPEPPAGIEGLDVLKVFSYPAGSAYDEDEFRRRLSAGATAITVQRPEGNDPDDLVATITGEQLSPDAAIEVIGIAMDHALEGLDLAAMAGFQGKLLAKLSRPPAPAGDANGEGAS